MLLQDNLKEFISTDPKTTLNFPSKQTSSMTLTQTVTRPSVILDKYTNCGGEVGVGGGGG